MAGSASAWEEAVSECAHRFSVFSRIALTVKELISLLRRSGRVSAAAVQRRGRAPQVGRERERSTQEAALARALVGGRGGVASSAGTGQQKKWFAMHAFRGAVAFPRGFFAGALAPGLAGRFEGAGRQSTRRGQLM